MTAHSVAQVITGDNSCVSFTLPRTHISPQYLFLTSDIVRSLVCCPHFRLLPQDPLRLPHPLQEVGATTQARPLAGVSLAGWLTPQTQVMSPRSQTSSATRIRSTRPSTFLTATMIPVDVTMVPTSPEGLPNSDAFSSTQKAAASRVSSLFGLRGPGKLSAGHVSGRLGLQETGAELDREAVATSLFGSR